MVRLLRPCLLILVALVAACAPLRMGHEPAYRPRPVARPSVPAAPPALTARLKVLGDGFDGRVGIAVRDIEAGWTAEFNGLSLLPQQSVSKLWVALALLDAVDKGAIGLDEPVTVTAADLSVFNQPIRERIGPSGFATTLGDLLVFQIARSDNAANDIVMRRVGGPEAVQKVIAARRLGAIHAGPEEKVLQTRIAALDWRPEFSFGRAFWTARDLIAPPVRAAALDRYLAEPEDGATAAALVEALGRLKRGDLLSPPSTERLMQTMALTDTGPMRLRAGLGEGWTIAHKTGTGQDLGDLSTGYNDVGLITAPDGRTYAVAVMIASTRRPVPERQALMASVAAAVVAVHDGRDPAAPTVATAAH